MAVNSASANRVRLSLVREVTPGTTPNTPRMRLARITDERLTFAPQYIDSNELRFDRMNADSIRVMQAAGGSITFETSYPEDASPLSELYRSAFYAAWVNTPQWYNDGVADSVITNATANTYSVTTGADVLAVGHLVRATGFTGAGNNQIFRVTTPGTSPGTAIVGTALSLTTEAAPPGTAKLKVVGFQGTAGDIVASSTGLTSTVLDFTTLGLVVGQWIKIGGTETIEKFSVAADNDWCRISAIAAHALTLDNRPTGWVTDSADSGNTIKVWFGDQIRNGVLQTALSTEIGFMDMAVPVYIQNNGMTVNTLDHNLTARQVITGTIAFMGMGGQQTTVSVDDSPDAATTNRVMAAHASVGRLSEAGTALIAPNWARSLTFQINNNLRVVEDVGQASPQAVNVGSCAVTGRVESFFGDNALLAKLYTGTPTSLSSRWQIDSQAVIWQFPRVTFRGGDPQVTGKNTDVVLPLDFTAAMDSITSSQVILDRIPYYE